MHDDRNPRLQHFLITRFNVRLGYRKDKFGAAVDTTDWLNDRLALFDRYCFPSVAGQSLQDFTWLMMVDEASEPWFLRRMEAYRERMPNLEIVRLPEILKNEQLVAPVLARIKPETRLLVTTRLDNDDGLHRDAMRTIRAAVRPRREFLNPRIGYDTDGDRAFVVSHKYGHFATLVEPCQGAPLVTVHTGLGHGRATDLAPVRQLAARPLWLRVIHERNIANRLVGDEPTADLPWTPRGVHKRLRVLGRRLRRWSWPREWRQPVPLSTLARDFSLQPG